MTMNTKQCRITLMVTLLASGPVLLLAQPYTTIDCPDSSSTLARGINDLGNIVGQCADANGTHAFLFRNGAFTIIDVPGAAATFANGINNRGDLVGWYQDDRNHGFLLRNGHFRTIDPPGSID